MLKRFLILFLLTVPVTSQEVNVIRLSEADSKEAKDIVILQKWLDGRKAALAKQIIRDYLEAPNSQTAGCVVDQMLIVPSYGCGEFVFSTDYTSILPASHITTAPYDSQLYQLINGNAVGIKEENNEN